MPKWISMMVVPFLITTNIFAMTMTRDSSPQEYEDEDFYSSHSDGDCNYWVYYTSEQPENLDDIEYIEYSDDSWRSANEAIDDSSGDAQNFEHDDDKYILNEGDDEIDDMSDDSLSDFDDTIFVDNVRKTKKGRHYRLIEPSESRRLNDSPINNSLKDEMSSAIDQNVPKISLHKARKLAAERERSRKQLKIRMALNSNSRKNCRRVITCDREHTTKNEDKTLATSSMVYSFQPDMPDVIAEKRLQNIRPKPQQQTCGMPLTKHRPTRIFPPLQIETPQSFLMICKFISIAQGVFVAKMCNFSMKQ